MLACSASKRRAFTARRSRSLSVDAESDSEAWTSGKWGIRDEPRICGVVRLGTDSDSEHVAPLLAVAASTLRRFHLNACRQH